MTVSGASFMNQAGASGPYIPIKYFVPVYDHRYDSYVHATSALIPVSAGDFTSAVNPFGDIIWNMDSLYPTSSYSMSNQEFLIFDPNQLGTTTITNSSFDGTSFVTLKSGKPISLSISATSFVYNYPDWTVDGYTLISNDNSIPTGYSNSRQKYFDSVSYSPISSAAGGMARGLFKIRIGNQTGNFKFNKIALYAAKILADGTEDTSVEPVLFGVAMLKEPIIKSNDGYNISFFELDVELQFSSNGYFSQTLFTNNTEWTIAGDNLWWDRRIIIGSSGAPGSYTAYAKVHIVESNPAVPQLRLTDDNLYSYVDEFVSHSNTENLIDIKGSKTNLIYTLETSGSSRYSDFDLRLDSDLALRRLRMTYTDPTSGFINTGWTSTYGGYQETSEFIFDSNTLATFRSSNGSFGSLVLGLDSSNLFQHTSKFLTVHGGALLVGSCQVSGSLSGNTQWYTDSLLLGGALDVNGVATLNAGIVFGVGIQGFPGTYIYTDNLRVTTSAAFYNKVLMSGLNTLGSPILSANGYIVGGNLYSNNSISSFGNLYVSGIGFLNQLVVSGTSLMNGEVDMNGDLIVNGNFTSSLIYCVGPLSVNGDSTFLGNANFYQAVIANNGLNVSGSLSVDNILNVLNGDINIKTPGKGILISRGSGSSTAGITSIGGLTTKDIGTTAVKSSPKSNIFISVESTTGALGDGTLYPCYVHSIVDGVGFTVRSNSGTFPAGTYLHWLVINEAV